LAEEVTPAAITTPRLILEPVAHLCVQRQTTVVFSHRPPKLERIATLWKVSDWGQFPKPSKQLYWPGRPQFSLANLPIAPSFQWRIPDLDRMEMRPFFTTCEFSQLQESGTMRELLVDAPDFAGEIGISSGCKGESQPFFDFLDLRKTSDTSITFQFDAMEVASRFIIDDFAHNLFVPAVSDSDTSYWPNPSLLGDQIITNWQTLAESCARELSAERVVLSVRSSEFTRDPSLGLSKKEADEDESLKKYKEFGWMWAIH
jgi:hypothetical protein